MDWSEFSYYFAVFMGVFAAGFLSGVSHAWIRRIFSAV
jgi:hypothetical protein